MRFKAFQGVLRADHSALGPFPDYAHPNRLDLAHGYADFTLHTYDEFHKFR